MCHTATPLNRRAVSPLLLGVTLLHLSVRAISTTCIYLLHLGVYQLPSTQCSCGRFYWHYVHQLNVGAPNVSLNFWVGHKGHGRLQRNRLLPTGSLHAM